MPYFKKSYDYSDPSKTKQSFHDECDINKIMRKYMKVVGGTSVNDLPVYQSGQYGDFTGVKDYQSALDSLNRAKESFDAFPLELRRLFDYSPAKFLDFYDNPVNLPKLVEWGLVKPSSAPPAGSASTPSSTVKAEGKPLP